MERRHFISRLSVFTAGACLAKSAAGPFFYDTDESSFAKHLQPAGRALEMEGYYVWCNSPIEDEQGKIHVFFSRWDAKKGMGGWIKGSEIAHAVADAPEGTYQYVETILS